MNNEFSARHIFLASVFYNYTLDLIHTPKITFTIYYLVQKCYFLNHSTVPEILSCGKEITRDVMTFNVKYVGSILTITASPD